MFVYLGTSVRLCQTHAWLVSCGILQYIPGVTMHNHRFGDKVLMGFNWLRETARGVFLILETKKEGNLSHERNQYPYLRQAASHQKIGKIQKLLKKLRPGKKNHKMELAQAYLKPFEVRNSHSQQSQTPSHRCPCVILCHVKLWAHWTLFKP